MKAEVTSTMIGDLSAMYVYLDGNEGGARRVSSTVEYTPVDGPKKGPTILLDVAEDGRLLGIEILG